MKFSCTQENLAEGLNIVSHIANKSTSLPILNNVLIKASGGTIVLTTTNLEIGINCTIRGKVDEEGSFTVGSKLLTDFVNLLPGQKVDVQLKGDVLAVSGGKSSTKMKGNSAEEFPVIPHIVKKVGYSVGVSDFIHAVSQVVFAASTSETRPEISGIYFNFEGNTVTLAATDSYRLAEKVIALTNTADATKEVIIPARTVQELHRILSGYSGLGDEEVTTSTLEIFFEDNQVQFVCGEIELVSRIIEGQYPNYRQVIPAASKTKAIITSAEFIKATKTAALFSRTGIYDITLELKKDTCAVTATNVQLGENRSEVEIDLTGEENSIVLNCRYLIDGLQNCDSDSVAFEMTNSATAALLRPAGDAPQKGPGAYTYLIMPIKQ